VNLAALDVLLGYQQRWIADRSPVKVAQKGRRIGLTYGEAADSALEGARELGQDTWYIGYNQDMGREFIETVGDWARRIDAAVDTFFEEVAVEDDKGDIQAYRVRFASGHKVTALSSRPSNLRGKQGRVRVDEAAFHPALAELLKSALALNIWGGSVGIISTHDGVSNPFNELVEDIRKGRKDYSLHTITFDQALEEGLYRRICEVKGVEWSPEAEAAWRAKIFADYGDAADEELLCIPKASSGSYIPTTLVESRMTDAKVIRLTLKDGFLEMPEHQRVGFIAEWCEQHLAPELAKLDPKAESFLGEDFGRTINSSVLWPVQIQATLRRHTPFAVEMNNVPHEAQRQIVFYVIDRLPRFGVGAFDAGGNGSYLAEVTGLRYGASRIHKVMLSQSWYAQHVPPYKAALEDDAFSLPRDRDILADHRALVLVNGIPSIPAGARARGQAGNIRHGDSVVAAMLAHYATRQPFVPIEFQSSGRTRPSSEVGDAFGGGGGSRADFSRDFLGS